MNQYMNATRRLRSLFAAFAPPLRKIARNAEEPHASLSYFTLLRRRLDDWKHNGTPEMVFGVLVLGYAGVDYTLDHLRARQRDEVRRQLERAGARDGRVARARDRARFEEAGGAGMTASRRGCRCVVRRVPRAFDGHRCLTDARRGDVVDVIDEGVGPGGRYSFCALRRGAGEAEEARTFSLGWFPNKCLQKID